MIVGRESQRMIQIVQDLEEVIPLCSQVDDVMWLLEKVSALNNDNREVEAASAMILDEWAKMWPSAHVGGRFNTRKHAMVYQ